MATLTIEPSILDILRTAVIDGNSVRLTCGQLDRKTYQSVNDTLTRMGGKWKGGKVAAHVFDRDPTPILEAVLGDGKNPPKNPLAFFATPSDVAARMIELAEVPHSDERVVRILEPSAGDGALIWAVREAGGSGHIIQGIEIDPVRCDHINRIDDCCLNMDFLDLIPGDFPGPFNRVLMNPPFTSPTDPIAYVAHVRHSFEFLRPGGRLVAVAPAGFTFAGRNKALGCFRDFVAIFGRWEMLPEGSFKDSGTGVNCCLVVLDKPL